jgi:hypothetical protein
MKHWSERLHCHLCGMTFRSAMAEARHRHNAPMLCRPTKAGFARVGKARRNLHPEKSK